MKHIILSALMVLTAHVAQAKVICNLASGDQKHDMVFDQELLSIEVTSPRYLVVSKDTRSAQEVQFNRLSFADWKAINGQTLVSLSSQGNGLYGITVSQIEVTKKNVLPLEAMALGTVTDQQFLNLIVPEKNLSIICTTLK